MIFGEKFYSYLNELSPWQCSLYGLCLAIRMSPNFYLYAEVSNLPEAKKAFSNCIDGLVRFHTDKHNDVSLEPLLLELEKFIPNLDVDSSFGAFAALDACIAVSSSINAIIDRVGEESVEACNASICTVAKYLELSLDRELDNDELREMDLIFEEMEYQVSLHKFITQKKSPDDVSAYLSQLLRSNCSNIGISV